MNIDSIKNGIVIDHIQANRSMAIYEALGLDKLSCTVAIIRNVKSNRMGRKDIIKIDEEMEVDLDILGYIDPDITVNIIHNDEIVEKKHLELPKRIVNMVQCKNPRCITSIEREIDHVFELVDGDKHIYRCVYCDTERK